MYVSLCISDSVRLSVCVCPIVLVCRVMSSRLCSPVIVCLSDSVLVRMFVYMAKCWYISSCWMHSVGLLIHSAR